VRHEHEVGQAVAGDVGDLARVRLEFLAIAAAEEARLEDLERDPIPQTELMLTYMSPSAEAATS